MTDHESALNAAIVAAGFDPRNPAVLKAWQAGIAKYLEERNSEAVTDETVEIAARAYWMEVYGRHRKSQKWPDDVYGRSEGLFRAGCRAALNAVIPLFLAPSACVETAKGWQHVSLAPHACHVLASYFDMENGEWVYDVVMSPPQPPYTQWQALPSPSENIFSEPALVSHPQQTNREEEGGKIEAGLSQSTGVLSNGASVIVYFTDEKAAQTFHGGIAEVISRIRAALSSHPVQSEKEMGK